MPEHMDEKSSLFLIGFMMAANYSSLDEKSKKTLLEVLVMARPFEDFYQKWREEGKEEGMEEAVKLLLESGMPIHEVAERLKMKVSKVIAMTDKESIET